MDKTKPYRYKAGDKVVLVYLRHRPQAEVLLDQPRSSPTVHVRDQDGINRTPNVSNIMLHEDWVKQEEARRAEELAQAGPIRGAMLDTFRAALREYLQANSIPPKGKAKKAAIQAAYQHALAATGDGAVRYYDLGRGFANRRLRASRDGRTPSTPTGDEQLGLSLIMIGGQELRASYRRAARASQPVVMEGVIASIQAEPAVMQVEEEPKPKLEIHVELPAEVFDPKTELARKAMIVQWVELSARDNASAFLPDFPLIHHFTGVTKETYDEATATLQRNGYALAGMGLGWWVLPPRNQTEVMKEQVSQASLPELRAWFGLLLDEIGERTQEKQEAN